MEGYILQWMDNAKVKGERQADRGYSRSGGDLFWLQRGVPVIGGGPLAMQGELEGPSTSVTRCLAVYK